MVCNFNADLAYSHEQADLPMWRQIYARAFGAGITLADVRKHGWAQQAGIDRSIMMASGKTVTVDEKIRRDSWDDIALEFEHEYPSGHVKRGWVEKSLACDFICYGWAPKGECYLLPFLTLRRAWFKNRDEWKRRYKIAVAQNPDYITRCCCVPVDVLLAAIGSATCIEFDVN